MTDLDDLLEHAARDLDHALDRLTVPAEPITSGRRISTRPTRTIVLAAAAVVLIAGTVAVTATVRRSHPVDEPPAQAPATPATTTAQSSLGLLDLAAAPAGFHDAGLAQLPSDSLDRLDADAIFIHTDGTGALTNTAVMRVGTFDLIDNYPKQSSSPDRQRVTFATPASLRGATDGYVLVDQQRDDVYLGIQLANDRVLSIDYPNNFLTPDDDAVAAVEAILAAITVAPDASISISGTLPLGWSLADHGPEPAGGVLTYEHAYSDDTHDVGLMISNFITDNQNIRYWLAYQTLTPTDVRGHHGWSSSVRQHGDRPAMRPENAVIWEEQPGVWVRIFSDGLTPEQLVDLADHAITVGPDHWQTPAATTTTPPH